MKRTAIPKKRRGPPRRGPLRDPKYRKWLRTENCVIGNGDCVGVTVFFSERRFGPCCDPAHTQNNGTSSKGPDSSCAPLCRKHHAEYDAGRVDFETKYGVDMKEIAATYWARYQQERAAAPDLLEALQGALNILERYSEWVDDLVLTHIRETIAKAKGADTPGQHEATNAEAST